MGWWIALAVIFLLAILPLGASVKYDESGPLVRLIAGPARITLFPTKKKEKKVKKTPKEKKPKDEKKPGEKKTAQEKKSGGKLMDFLPLVRVALDFLRDFKWKLRVNRLEMKLILAGDDPCDLAVNYGKACAALGNLVPQLEKFFVIKKRDMQVECDFTADEMYIYARLDLTITLGRLIGLAVRYGVKAVWQFIKIMNLRKGGASE